MQNVTNPVVFSLLASCRIFLCSLTLSNTSSFLTLSVQLSLYMPTKCTLCIKYIYLLPNISYRFRRYTILREYIALLARKLHAFDNVVTYVMYLVCNIQCACSWNMEEVIDYKNVRNRKLANKVK
jgi:hypothetical protein